MTKMVLKTVPLGVLFTTTLTRRVGVRVKWPHDWAQDGARAEETGEVGDVAVYFDDGETQRVRGELVVEVEEVLLLENVSDLSVLPFEAKHACYDELEAAEEREVCFA